MKGSIYLAFYILVIIESIVVKVIKLRGILLWDRASKGCDNVDFYKGSPIENN